MSIEEEVRQLLVEIRDNQRESLRRQQEQLDIAKQQLERTRAQITESLDLQKEAIAKARMVGRIALPGIALCIGLIAYLIVKYF